MHDLRLDQERGNERQADMFDESANQMPSQECPREEDGAQLEAMQVSSHYDPDPLEQRLELQSAREPVNAGAFELAPQQLHDSGLNPIPSVHRRLNDLDQ